MREMLGGHMHHRGNGTTPTAAVVRYMSSMTRTPGSPQWQPLGAIRAGCSLCHRQGQPAAPLTGTPRASLHLPILWSGCPRHLTGGMTPPLWRQLGPWPMWPGHTWEPSAVAPWPMWAGRSLCHRWGPPSSTTRWQPPRALSCLPSPLPKGHVPPLPSDRPQCLAALGTTRGEWHHPCGSSSGHAQRGQVTPWGHPLVFLCSFFVCN